jgi:hypothetical protein
LDYAFFDNRPHDQYRRLLLRNSGNDENVTYFRDAAIQRIVSELNIDYQEYQPSIVFINGEFWGLLNLRERQDKYYLARHYGLNPDKLDILERNSIVIEGDIKHYNAMRNFMASNDMKTKENLAYINTQMDIANFRDYQITQIFIRNFDWPSNNINYWRYKTDQYNPGAPKGQDGRWRWLLYDTDHGFGYSGGATSYEENALERAIVSPGREWSTFILQKLLENDSFKNDFINRFADLLNTTFLPDRMIGVINELKKGIEANMPAHIHRWSRLNSMDHWDNRIEVMRIFARERPAFQRQHIREYFGITQPEITLRVDVADKDHGYMRVNTLLLKSPRFSYPWSGQYFYDIPIQIEAIALPGYIFSHWTGNESLSPILTIRPKETINLVAHFMEEKIEEENEIIHYWHFNQLSGKKEEVKADLSLIEKGKISYIGTGEGYMDSRSFRADDPVSNLNLLLQQKPDFGVVLRVRNPSNNRELIIDAPTKGFKEITFKYATTRTTNGASEQELYYSSGNEWKLLDSYEVSELSIEKQNNGWQLQSYDLIDIPEVNNNNNLRFKIVFTGDNTINTSGNNRFDNISIRGEPLLGTIPHKLVIHTVNNGNAIFVNQEFTVTVQIQDVEGLITNTLEPNQIFLSLFSGSGNLLGTTTQILEIGKNKISFPNLLYDKIEEGVIILASAHGLQSGTSEIFSVQLGQVSVVENSLHNIRIFPNPASDFIWIETSEIIKDLTVFDIAGRNMLSAGDLSSNPYQMNVKQLDSGLYFLRLTYPDGHYILKFHVIR